MKNKKKIFIIFIIIVIVAIFSVGLFIRQRERFDMELDSVLSTETLEDLLAAEELDPLKEFSGSPVVTGEFIEIDKENDLLSVRSYDSVSRDDIVFTAQITDDTIFIKKMSQDEKEKLYTKEEFYSDFLSDAKRIFHLRVTADDIKKKFPEAFIVELVDLELFKYIPFESENL